MGIEAFCPNGHRIKVKESLAGRKGLCPTCGAKFRIPHAAADVPGLPTARLLDVAPDVAATLPRVLPYGTPDIPSPAPSSTPSPAFVTPPAPVTTASPIERAAAAPALHPVLAERPELRWCIAFPGGDPTEPLPPESMQAWLESGQAEGTEVVWRSDWPEWRPARDVFVDVLG